MSTPISSNNPFAGVRPPTPASTHRPSDPSAVDRTAEEFAALLGAEPPEQPRRTEDVKDRDETSSSSDSFSEVRSESDSDRPRDVGRRGRRDENSGDDESDDEGSQEPPVRSLGDAILDGMSKTASTRQVEAAPPPDAAGFDHVVQQICDKILVSDPGTGAREVRILLKESALPGTEIRILQDAGKLQVQFITDNVDVQNRLSQHQATLQTLLNEKLEGRDVVVEVAMESGHQDPGDGRSRQRRDLQQEAEQENK
jgi:type III secretion system needle length determinant